MPKQNMSKMWTFEDALLSGQLGNSIPMSVDPATGEQMVPVPESSEEEKKLAKALSPNGKPSKEGLKMLLPEQKPVTKEMLNKDVYNWDKEKIKELLNREQSGIEQQAQALQNMKELPLQPNWKPLAGFVGTMVKGGDKFADAFPDVESPEQRMMKIQQLENLLQNQRGDLTKNAMGLLRAEIDKQSLRQSRFAEAQLLKKETELQKDLDTSLFKPMATYETTVGSMEDLIKEGTLQSVQQAVSNFARAISGEKGVLTDQDIARIYPPSLQLSLDKAVAWVSSNPNQKLPPEIVQNLLQGVQVSKRNAGDVFAKIEESKKNLYSGRQSYRDVMSPLGFGPKAFEEVSRRRGTFGVKSTPPQVPSLPNIDAIQAEIERRKGAQK